MPDSDTDWINRARGMRPSEAMMNVFSAIILAAGGMAIYFMEQFTRGLARVLDVFGAVRDFFVALISEPVTIIEATTRFTAFELTAGDWAFFGPFTFAAGLAAIALGFWVWYAIGPPIPVPGFLGRFFGGRR